MKNKRHLIILFGLIVALVASCGSPVTPTDTPPPVTPTATPPPVTNTPTATEIDVVDFALNEIIITGPLENVENIVGDPAARGLELIAEVDLSYLAEREGQEPDEFPKPEAVEKTPLRDLFEGEYRSLVMRLYQNLDDISTLLPKIQEINDAGNEFKVFADPNYMTDPLGPGSCGNPYSGGGSPYSGGGSPLGGLGINIDPATFGNQWAFKPVSVVQGGSSIPQNPLVMESEIAESEFSGAGSTIGVFDTAPWTIPASPWKDEPTFPMPDGSTVRIPVVDAVNKYHQLAAPTPGTTPTPRATPTPVSNRIDVADHGLFIASQIHAVAPDSDIYLYRVLGDDGCGNLFILAAAMHEFVNGLSLPTKRLERVVINLSLGVHIPDGIYYKLKAGNNLPREIAALDMAIFGARYLGAVIVAASGNDSASPGPWGTVGAQRMQLPAFYSNVIGVAASDQNGQRSCFSNMGDVAAPGGNGGQAAAQPCAPRTADALVAPQPCDPADMGMCHYGVIGSSRASPTGFGLWSGTSFSAPVVSGLAALAFEKAQGNRALVNCLIQTGARAGDAALGWGTIDVAQSLGMQQCP